MSKWAVWTDPNNGCVYATWASRPDSMITQRRLWELRANGDAVEVSDAVLPVQPPPCAIDALADLAEPATLAAGSILAFNGVMYARSGKDVYAHDEHSGEWRVCPEPPPELVKLRHGGLAIRDE